MKNIVLVGFMGTGKTETAKILAKRLKLAFFSMDDEIEKRQAMKIGDIFKLKGEAHFRKLEAELAQELASRSGLVIDAGGGVVLNPKNIEDLKKNGMVICLTSSAEKILERTSKYTHRPLLNVDDPLAKIKELLDKRQPCYEAAADYTIDGTDLTCEQQAEKILKFLDKYLSK